jgi:DNA polymerase-4
MQSEPLRWILHLDMDAFYAAVEVLDNPELKGKPVIIGGAERGVVSTASYEARKYGVRSAMPMFQARKLCPHAVFIRGRMERYVEKSREVMALLERFSPLVEKASVDEAYLDATGLERVFGSALNMARELQATIYEHSRLSCSIGLAPVKFLAKIASDMQKPKGLTVLSHAETPAFLERLPVGKIPGVGPRMLKALELLGVRTAGDVQRYPKSFWQERMGKAGEMLFERGHGIDPRAVEPYSEPKSESAENTFAKDISDMEELSVWLLRQAERVGKNLRAGRLAGRTITLKLKYNDFTQKTRSRTLKQPTNLTRTIYDTAMDLLRGQPLERPLRLIGVGVSLFGASEHQLALLPDPEERDIRREAALDATLDALRGKFGSGTVVRGKLFTGNKEDT